jgi:hypothetical protein
VVKTVNWKTWTVSLTLASINVPVLLLHPDPILVAQMFLVQLVQQEVPAAQGYPGGDKPLANHGQEHFEDSIHGLILPIRIPLPTVDCPHPRRHPGVLPRRLLSGREIPP